MVTAHDRKRASSPVAKCATKKLRESPETQTVESQPQDSQPQESKKTQTLSDTKAQESKKLLEMKARTLQKQRSLAASFITWKSCNLHQMQQFNAKFKQRLTSLPATSFTPPISSATPSIPPNWLDHYEDTILSPLTFKKYRIDASTAEYQTIERMLQPIQVNRMEKIVNPDLWKRFINARKEMLRSKTDDLNLLSELGLDERDIMRCTHLVLNHKKSTVTVPFSDNMALLFHCTKHASNLNDILSQGLDERLSHVFGGRLGKGIYFADDPQKSLQYDGTGRIFVFAVLLGDCISVDHFPYKNALVREPEKRSQEMRNLKDHFFDSIVGRPAGHNEYVIYNR